MKTIKAYFLLISTVIFSNLVLNGVLFGQEYEIRSPDKKIAIKISIKDKIFYSVCHNSKELIAPSSISLTTNKYGILGKNPEVENVERTSMNEIIYPAVRVKSKSILDNYNEISFDFKKQFGLIFRAYNDGAAYRFRTYFDKKITVISEEVTFNFVNNHYIYFPTEESFLTHSERLYEYIPIADISSNKMSSIPALVDIQNGPKIAITEADLEDYPGLYLTGSNSASLYGKFPAVPLKEEQTNDRTVKVIERADYIATSKGNRLYPWRVLVIAENDGKLIESQIVYKLSKPVQLNNTSWIKPGKVAWDWWNANNIYGVDFRAGINTDTYKYYIDFASKYGIEYVILDEGWYELGDLFKINPEIDIKELLDYAHRKNVGIILWVVWKTLDDQLHDALNQFEQWGVKGIKVDFMQRDDQWMVNYYHKIAKESAKRHLLVDFHGAYKPAGLRRAYPNVLTREGVRGLEHSKWSNHPTPEHNVTLPFIRMLAGPMDYTPGAMNNAQEKNFNPIFTRPMSLGTRCHQLAMYVIFESPLQMLSDNPSNYLREQECMEFLSKVPTEWDETIALDARAANYVLIARKSGKEWYVGAMTDWTPRELLVDFFFLDPGIYTIHIYKDGINAERYGSDYQKVVTTVTNTDKLKIKLAPGGGWAARIFKSANH